MVHTNRISTRSGWMLLAVSASLALATGGCSSHAQPGGTEEKAVSSGGANSNIDMDCLPHHIENPPEPFHYSYKVDGPNAVDKEADITPQTMDITIQDKSGSHTYHGVRSDSGSWGRAFLDLTGSGLTGMWARIGFLKDKSALKSAGAETLNGYATTKYSIDSANADSSAKRAFAAFYGAGSYDKGSIWVTGEGCPVKLSLDEATQQANGSMNKVHYEMAVTRK
jgi:hypothetical protein